MSIMPMAQEILAESIKAARENVIYKLNANKSHATKISFDENYALLNVLRHLTPELIKAHYNIMEHRAKDGTTKYYYISWDRDPGSEVYTFV